MKLNGDRNQCPACKDFFNSTRAFDKHRTGDFEKDRRCMTIPERLDRLMAKNKDGFWVTQLMPKAALSSRLQ